MRLRPLAESLQRCKKRCAFALPDGLQESVGSLSNVDASLSIPLASRERAPAKTPAGVRSEARTSGPARGKDVDLAGSMDAGRRMAVGLGLSGTDSALRPADRVRLPMLHRERGAAR